MDGPKGLCRCLTNQHPAKNGHHYEQGKRFFDACFHFAGFSEANLRSVKHTVGRSKKE
jgi:hypothetical protein